MADYTIKHDRPNCIGCGACAAIAPDYWSMGEDGKSNVKGATKVGETEELEITQAQFDANKSAADSCPVNVIHLIDKKTGSQLI